ncbi:MAG TPA: hypothetical protein VMT52_19715 [Planctomycetota bacterium]|nr:hypothetical protein [Planctomycetota bacterium]
MKLSSSTLAVLALAIGACGTAIWYVLDRRPVVEDTVREPEAVAEPFEPPPIVEVPLPRRELAISGRVVAKDLQSVPGIRVLCGGEEAVTDAEGVFSLPPALRPPRTTVRLLSGETEVARWEGVVTGDPAPEPPQDAAEEGDETVAAPFRLEETLLPARPERLRWSFNLPGADGEVPLSKAEWLGIDDLLAEDWGNGARLRVHGRSRLPDGAHVTGSLYFDGFRFLATVEPASVEAGRFTASMVSPMDLKLYSGTYEVQVSFNTLHESVATLSQWQVAHPGEDWEAFPPADAMREVFVGFPAEARGDDMATGEYYSRVLDMAKQLERLLKARADEVRLLGKGWDPALLEARRSARSGWFEEAPVSPEGVFAEAAWRRFLDGEWRPRVQALLEEHSARGQEKYREAGTRMGALLKALHDESFVYSRFVVYPLFQLRLHENDFYPDEDQVGDLIRLEDILADNFKGLERFRRLGR